MPQSKIEHYIDEEDLEDVTQVLVDEFRVKIILSPVLFDSGKAKLKNTGTEILAGLHYFDNVINPLIVEGHTDSIPLIQTLNLTGNYHFSSLF